MDLPPTNYEKWQLFMKYCPSPQSYIDMGWYNLIASALQRRVWLSEEHSSIFPNIYVILVGRPGLGKGLVIKPVASLLKEHKLNINDKTKEIATGNAISNEKVDKAIVVKQEMMEEIAKMNAEADGEKYDNRTKNQPEAPLLFPVAADATSYEALVRSMARAFRRINYYKPPDNKLTIYTHSSLCFCLEEISSLFRKRTEDTVNFLLSTYDCGDYKYDTKTQGMDNIKRCCLNFFGGTTPKFMETIFDTSLVDEGFSSRTWFVFEHKNRFYNLMVKKYDPEQLAARAAISQHILKLSTICGQVTFSEEASLFLKHWWEVETLGCTQNIVNSSEKLEAYYSRKNLHVMKLAMILHFAEVEFDEKGKCKSMVISLACCKRALEILNNLELRMHYALNFGSTNPLFKLGQRITRFITRNGGAATKREIMLNCYEFSPTAEAGINECLVYLLSSNKLADKQIEQRGKQVTVYYIPDLSLEDKVETIEPEEPPTTDEQAE